MANGLNPKTKQLLTYIIKNRSNVSITELMKLSYIIDLVSINKKQNKVFDFKYIRFNYGPFDKKIYDYIKYLVDNDIVLEGSKMASTGDEFVVFRINNKADVSFSKISKEEKNTIDEVLEALEGHGAKALTDLAYSTKPMKKLGAKINNSRGLNSVLDLYVP